MIEEDIPEKRVIEEKDEEALAAEQYIEYLESIAAEEGFVPHPHDHY